MNFLLSLSTKIVKLLAPNNFVTNENMDGLGGGGPESTGQLKTVSNEVNKILRSWVGPLFIAIGGVGAIYIIVLAIQYIRSENDSKRAEAKQRIINCVIGVICLLVIGGVCIGVDWGNFVQLFSYTKKEKAVIGLLMK